MSRHDLERLVRAFFSACQAGDLPSLDQLVSPGYLDHARWGDRAGLKRTVRDLHALGEIKCDIADIVCGDDRVVVRYEIGVRGKTVKAIRAVSILRIEAGVIAEHWGHSDSFF